MDDQEEFDDNFQLIEELNLDINQLRELHHLSRYMPYVIDIESVANGQFYL